MNKNRAERSDSRITSPAGKQTRAEQPMTLLYAVAALFSLLGLADAIYLTIEHVTGQSVRCTIVAGCSEVLSSSYSTVAGVPLAAVGAVAYFCVFSLATLAGFRDSRLLSVLPFFRCYHDHPDRNIFLCVAAKHLRSISFTEPQASRRRAYVSAL